ncbi:glycosyltransferase [Spiribacter sp. 218]|uniref:glycosyltransferase n=1 Tax=Spiribacter pallidus TaxID=1987936 RepID=UPI00349F2C8C
MASPGGGAERVLADVASGLAERGHSVTLISFDAAYDCSFYSLSPQVYWKHVDVGFINKRATVLDLLQRAWALRQSVRNLNPKVTVGFMSSAYVPLAIALLGTRTPLVASEHIVPEYYRTRRLEQALVFASMLICRLTTVVSDQVLSAFPRMLRNRLRVVHNPVTLRGDDASNDPATEGGTGRKTLLSVGRLEPQKDHSTLITAFCQIADDFPDWDLRIVGEGALRSDLEAQIARAGLQNRVSLVGVRSDISREYASAQCFVMPSRYESLGVAAAEAISHGLPAVGFADCLGVNQLITEGVNGRLVPANECRVEGLARILGELMADPIYRLSLAGGEATLPHHVYLERVLDRWEKILREAAPE